MNLVNVVFYTMSETINI